MDFDDLILQCAGNPSARQLTGLLDGLKKHPDPASCGDSLKMMMEEWNPELLSDAQASFCMELAKLPVGSLGAAFREKLAAAVKKVLPPYLARTGLLRALGVRDEALEPAKLMERIGKLMQLKSGMVIFLGGDARRFGMVGSIDNVSGMLTVGALGENKTSMAMALAKALEIGTLLSPGAELIKLIDVNNRYKISGRQFRTLVQSKAQGEVSEETLRLMAQCGAGKNLSPEAFEEWFGGGADTVAASSASAPAGNTRRSCDGRSLQEIKLLLEKEECVPLSDEEAVAFAGFFDRLKAETAGREAKLLADVVIRLRARTDDKTLAGILDILCGKAPFWPENPASARLEDFGIWGELAVRDMDAMASATATIFPPEYLAACALRLPLKSLNSVCAKVPAEMLRSALGEARSCGCDMLLWIWKNSKKCGADMLALVNIENVIRALLLENLPKPWGPAQRELKQLLLDNAPLQKHLVAAAGDNGSVISNALQGALFLVPSERQSLLVKLSRISDAVREYIESGAGKKILSAGMRDGENAINTPKGQDILLTGAKSHKRLLDELDDIINVQIPENRESLKTARAHGDFRENSEFDAAKERRNYLSRRRSELEREVGRTQTIKFADVKVTGTVVIGCAVALEYDGGKNETLYVLGAWDGDPDRNYLAYRTRLGAALLGHRAGEKLELPGGRSAVVKSVEALPDSIIAELD